MRHGGRKPESLRRLLGEIERLPADGVHRSSKEIDLGVLDEPEDGPESEHLMLCLRCRGFYIDQRYRHDYGFVTAGVMIEPPATTPPRRPRRVAGGQFLALGLPFDVAAFGAPATQGERGDLWFEASTVGRICACDGRGGRERSRREVDEALRHIVQRSARARSKRSPDQ